MGIKMNIHKKNILFLELEKEFQKIQEVILKQPFPKGFPDALIYLLSEISANIAEHSKAESAEIRLKIENQKVTFVISDNGIGIRKSFLQNNNYAKDDKTAITFALSGLSTKKSNERAFGLYSIRQLVEHQKGIMEIISGNSTVKISNGKLEFFEN